MIGVENQWDEVRTSILHNWERQYSNTSSSGPLVWATLLLSGIYALHRYALPADWMESLRRMLFESGWVPYGIVWWGIFGVLYLMQIMTRRWVPLENSTQFEGELLAVAQRSSLDSRELRQVLLQYAEKRQMGYFANRFLRLIRLYDANPDLSAVQRLRDEILEHDEYMHQLSFSAVRCAEWAMPLFGFLGTVIGIGQAISALNGGLKFVDGKLVTDPTLVRESFAGMAIAFETTLEGLVGLLIVGTLHAFMRKRLDSALARAQPYFTQLIENTPSRPVSVRLEELHVLDADMELLRSEMQLLRDDMSERYIHQRQIESLVETVIDQDPQYKSIKEILFTPLVEFDVAFQQFSAEMAKYLADTCQAADWKFVAGASSPVGSWNATLVDFNLGRNMGVCFFSLADTSQRSFIPLAGRFDRLHLVDDEHAWIHGEDKRWHMLRRSAGGSELDPVLPKDVERLYPIQADSDSIGLIAIAGDATSRRIGVRTTNGRQIPFQTISASSAVWTLSALSPKGDAVVLGGDTKGKPGDSSLLYVPIQHHQKTKNEKKQPEQPPAPDLNQAYTISLGAIQSLKQIEWISPHELLLLNRAGQLWLFDLRRESPISLEHDHWKPAADTVIVVGRDRWFASYSQQRLSMWKVWRTGKLHDYVGSKALKVDRFNAQDVGVSQEGRLLWAAVDQRIAVWRFPEYQSDRG